MKKILMRWKKFCIREKENEEIFLSFVDLLFF